MSISWRRIREHPTRQHAADLEHQLIADAADAVKAASKDTGGWWQLNRLRQRSTHLVRQFLSGAVATARTAVAAAARTGREQAETDLRKHHLTVVPTHTDIPVAAKAEHEVTEAIKATAPHAIRSGDRLYTEALAAILSQPAQSEAHRLRVAQAVLDRLAGEGITGFQDKAGRNWNLVSYMEMATKTTAMNAMLDAHVQTLSAHGQHLVVIDGAVDCCPVCAPWHGRRVSIDAPVEGVPTLADARAAGVWHPHCRCSVEFWYPGDPLPNVPQPDPQLYADRQHLRYLERQVRAAKRVKAAALDDLSLHAANIRIRAYQAKIRRHVSSSGQRRIRRREQIGRAL
ncbi:phage minor capsid protein [Nocardia sp. NPDC088792]|uniref:phage minor capsid protein n=1 Tax=Nocardia sp. NPDC088792 TaxID=3364332 RepID=UPI00381CA7D9